MEYLDENALRVIMMKIENEDDLKSWYSINNKFKNIYEKYKEEWYGKYEPVEDVDQAGNKRETKTIGNRKYIIAWYSSGYKIYEREYKNGKPEGKWTWWHMDGSKEIEQKYKNGKKCGIWKAWDVNGKLELQKNYGSCSGRIESISPRKKAISQKKCAEQGKMKNTITGGCRRKCKIGKEKIGSDGKCTKR